MLLRRISVERYGCFGTAEFDFRRGLNLVSGSNDSGKTLLLRALPAILLGIQNGVRLRSWGDSLSCRGTLLFEDGARQIRVQRDLENDLVRLEEHDGSGEWQELFSGAVPSTPSAPPRLQYFGHLQRLFGIHGEVLLQALLDPTASHLLCEEDGRLVDELFYDSVPGPGPAPDVDEESRRKEQIATLETELAADREEYRKGEEYLAWVRRRWERETGEGVTAKRTVPASKNEPSGPEQERDELARQLSRAGVPLRLPADLETLFAEAEGLRQELAGLQQELTPLQRSRQGVCLPSFLWPLLLTLLLALPTATAFWLKAPWLIAAAVGSVTSLVLLWGVFLVRRSKAKVILDDLDEQVGKVELKRTEALSRQEELAERFTAFDLPSSPVEMVKLQQLCRRHVEAIKRYRSLCEQLGAVSAPAKAERGDGHLRPEDLPEAEAKLEALGESLRQREARLLVLVSGVPLAAPSAPSSDDAVQRQKLLLQAVSQQMERLTGGRYRALRLEEGVLQLEAAPGRWATPRACGRGTAETLRLALRMALNQLTGARLPLTVDDLPSSLDAHRIQFALRAIERFAAEQQVLLAGSDEELTKRAGRERWPHIDLNQAAHLAAAQDEEDEHAGQLHLL